jgi:anti-repressor protein
MANTTAVLANRNDSGLQSNSVKSFMYLGGNEKYKVRCIIGEDGEPWFVAKDVAEALGYENTSEAIRDHCKRVVLVGGLKMLGASDYKGARDLGYSHNDVVRQYQIIPECDVYRLIMRSRLPAAQKFEEWVVGEVLPSIRKRGAYLAPTTAETLLNNPDVMIRMLEEIKADRVVGEKERRVMQKNEADTAMEWLLR